MSFRAITVAAAYLVMAASPVRADISDSERTAIPAAGINEVMMRDVSFTDLEYNGSEGATSFDITFERIVETNDQDEFDHLADDMIMKTDVSNGRLTIDFDLPRQTGRGIFDRIFDRDAEWKVKLTITGPETIDLDIDTDFGESDINNTIGNLNIDADFTDFNVTGHTGMLSGELDFGSLDAESIEGAFDITSNFSRVDLRLTALRGDSRVSTSFGNANIRIPEDTGAEIVAGSRGINYNLRRSESSGSGRNRIIGDGGNRIDLNASFGSITLSDYRPGDRSSSSGTNTGEFTLSRGMQWEFRNGSRSFTIRAESYSRVGGNPTAVLVSEGRDAPFQRISIIHTSAGILLTGIDGTFFDRDMSNLSFDPPKYWLPYDTSVSINDAILGSVITESRDDGFDYEIITPGGDRHRISISTTGGFTRFDGFRVTEASEPEQQPAETPPPPQFTSGAVRSVDIRLRGSRLLDSADINDRLDISTGTVYTRDEIDDAVEALEDDRFIDSAYFRITPDGDLTVTVYERDIIDTDHDLDFSFSRVGGVGVGPRFTLNSLAGPFTKISAGAEYHFANKEWTYDVTGEKRFFDPAHQLFIGGGYRDAYESVLDWAIPKDEASANAFLAGLENNNLYEVKGGTAFIGFSIHDDFSIRAAWFDEEFSSLKKHTNWSLFNAGHTKADNLPLIASFETRYSGMRYGTSYFYRDGFMQSRLTMEAEQGEPEHSGGIPESYTRYLGDVEFLWRFQWDNMMRFRVAGGYSDDDLPPQRAFRLGGLNTLRGYEFESVPTLDPRAGQIGFLYGGNSMMLANLDYIYGVENDMGIAFFADAGNVWYNDADLSDLKGDVGVGIIFGELWGYSLLDDDDLPDGLRINWATPVGDVPHTSYWTINFTTMF